MMKIIPDSLDQAIEAYAIEHAGLTDLDENLEAASIEFFNQNSVKEK